MLRPWLGLRAPDQVSRPLCPVVLDRCLTDTTLREHLYRKHALPKFTCHRCCGPFDTEEDLHSHARAAEPCQVREPQPADGFNQDQEKKLRSRKKTAGEELTEPEKWKQMYRTLFPDVREDEIPSPRKFGPSLRMPIKRGGEIY